MAVCSPAYGGKFCKGSREEFSICSKNPCPEPLRDFRAEQCARLPNLIKLDDPVKMNMTWLPYESEKSILNRVITKSYWYILILKNLSFQSQ